MLSLGGAHVAALNPLSSTQWAHLLTALAIWIGLPLLVGLWRIRRTDLA